MSQDYTTTITVAATPQRAFDAISDVAAWWGRITGTTAAVGDEFVYVVPGLHYSGFRVTALEPGSLVEWLVTGSYLDFVDDHQEWNGTTVRFEITPAGDGAAVVFTHEGLGQDVPCYETCANAWSMFVRGSLKALIETGRGTPYEFTGGEQLLPHEHEALHQGIAEAVGRL
ncbi:SRPBCC family protein [Microbacterium kyungheense]|uniref:Activator of Hsp90 ATPase-like protein n=1 Tax=Microbacterium kyungheense TaxID=1263636 RepID=A0A543FJN7_9MICO|nr:SRPBCC domain-containing protein [Microbacterium kyungheense]TQM33992.1 hypothetical protein FB391_0279 [Microbacterium kyungheense]